MSGAGASTRASSAALSALPLAAAMTLALARWLPIEFAYVPNDLGIVSAATVARYPIQQESFWAVFGVLVGAAAAWGIARALGWRAAAPRRTAAAEALAALALAAVLWLPAGVGEAVACAAAAGAIAVFRRGAPARAPGEPEPTPAGPRPGWGRRSLWLIGALVAALLLTSGLWIHLWNVAHRVPDEQLVQDHFKFLAETGQHLAWANALRHGWFQGRDVFCLYGPLYDLGLVGFWRLVGRSVAAWNLYWSLTRVAGWIGLFALGSALVRHRAAVWVLPFLLPWVELRVGWALFAALALYRWLDSNRAGWSVASGALTGVGLLYSQEFGVAVTLAALLGFAVRRDARAALLYAAGAALAMTPLFAYYAAHGALVPMLRDVATYPGYMLAGYGKLPFAHLVPNLPLPWSWAELGTRESETVRLSYAVPAVCLGGLLLAVPLTSFDWRRPFASLKRVADALARDPVRLMWLLIAVFGLVAFRSALGRSGLHRTHAVLPAAALLLCFGVDRTIDLWRRDRGLRVLAAWRAAALLLLAAAGGFLQSSTPLEGASRSLRLAGNLLREGHEPRGAGQLMRVTRYVQLHTEPAEPVLFLPNDAAYYYLADRPNPVRFVMGHQMAGDADRAEVLADLQAEPPRYVVWNHASLRVDDLPDEQVFGREILHFIETHYATEKRFGDVEILRHEQRTEPALVSGW